MDKSKTEYFVALRFTPIFYKKENGYAYPQKQ